MRPKAGAEILDPHPLESVQYLDEPKLFLATARRKDDWIG